MKSNGKLLFLVVVCLMVLLTACSTSTPTPTSTSVPTNTPLPTDTPTPIPTDTPTPTITPDVAATQTAAAQQTMEAKSAEVKAFMEGLEIDASSGSLAWAQQETIVLKNTGFDNEVYGTFAEGIRASDFVIKADITWDTKSFVGCGLILRSSTADTEMNRTSNNFYRFYYQNFPGLPGWHISYYKEGDWKYFVTRSWRWASAIKQQNGVANEFVIVAKGNEFTVFINNERVGRYIDDSKSADLGYFGSVIYQDTGESTCTFENGWLWVYK
jgi:hypothetical protein